MSKISVKEQLLEAAIVMIDEGGEANVRLEQLLKQVKVTAPTLYYYFGNREGLILEAQAERFSRVMRMEFPQFIEALKSCTTADDVRAALKFAFAFRNEPNRAFFRLKRLNAIGAAYARPELAERIVQVHEELVREVAEAFKPFQISGVIRPDLDLEAVVAWYNGAILGKALVDIAPSSINADHWDDVMAEAVDHLLFGHRE